MKFFAGLLFGGILAMAAFLILLYLTFPTGRVLQRWKNHDGQDIVLELREGAVSLHRLPWKRQGVFYLIGPDGRDQSIPVRIYSHDIDACVAQCEFSANGRDFDLKLPKDGMYTGKIQF